METQTMVERPLVFFIKGSKTNKILAVRLEGLFNVVGKAAHGRAGPDRDLGPRRRGEACYGPMPGSFGQGRSRS